MDGRTLARYAGTYRASGVELTVTHESGAIYLEGLGQGKNELMAESDTSFFTEGAAEFTYEFASDGSGKVTHMTISAGGQTLEAKRTS